METIVVVDDREEMRESVARYITLGLEDLKINWEVYAMGPLPELDDYSKLLMDTDLRVLVLDEKLAEEVAAGEDAVDYSGHQVAAYIRERRPDLPQVIITSVKNTEELANAAQLDAIVQRDEFDKHSDVWVERMVRLGKSFAERYEAELSDLAIISNRIVNSEATEADMKRIQAIREKKLLGNTADKLEDMQSWLQEAERIKAILQEIESKLSGNGA